MRPQSIKTVQPTSSLTVEAEAVTHALRWIASGGDSRTTHAVILTDSMSLLQKVKSEMGSPGWNVSMVDNHVPKLLRMYCPGHAGVKGNDPADRLAGRATLTSGLSLGRCEMSRRSKAMDISHTIHCLEEERRRGRGSTR